MVGDHGGKKSPLPRLRRGVPLVLGQGGQKQQKESPEAAHPYLLAVLEGFHELLYDFLYVPPLVGGGHVVPEVGPEDHLPDPV